ncbi:MAG: hypothetical protein KDD66_02015 [Bdellovibrionales bacterium]|nr:hypothetical protein [Bdellovibrionales bacterium]
MFAFARALFSFPPLVMLLLVGPLSAFAEEAASSDGEAGFMSELDKFITEGKGYVSTRYRYELVDQDGFEEDAKASTLRTRLGFVSGEVYGVSMKLEFEDVSPVGNDAYNSTVNGKTEYPVVADPDVTVVNEIYGQLNMIPDTSIRGGREALNLDNQRFIGDVGWRQNNQTFDGANISNESLENLKLWYGYVGKVNRIFGPDSPVGTYNTNLNLFNVAYSGLDFLDAAVYSYIYDVKSNPDLSTTNFGGHLYGSYPVADELDLLYDGEYAYQQDYEDNPKSFSVPYWRAEAGLGFGDFSAKAAYEVLGSDKGEAAFQTPFATLHKWNGWADKFLVTPDEGLQDAYGGLHYTLSDPCEHVTKLGADVVYHYFQSDYQSAKYGTEWDFNLGVDFLKYFYTGVTYAMYDAANFATDTDKLIFTVQAVFRQ